MKVETIFKTKAKPSTADNKVRALKIIATILAFISTYFFFFKLLFL
jgi:hypothetical protein